MYKHFESDQTVTLVRTMESFVALLRGTRTSNKVDVELYLRDYSKLQFKLRRQEINHLSISVIDHHKKQLAECKQGFTDKENPDFEKSVEFYIFWKYASQYCDFAEKQLIAEADMKGTNIVEAECEQAKSQKKLSQDIISMWEENGIEKFYNESVS